MSHFRLRLCIVLVAIATLAPLSLAQVARPSTQPTTQDTRERDRNRIFTLEEAFARFELDTRLTLCHVWPVGENAIGGFVEHPQYQAVFERAARQDVSRVKLLPEESNIEHRFGIVSADRAILRQDPTDRPGDRDNVSELVVGEPVFILDGSANGPLLVHSSDGYLGWVDSDAVQTIGSSAMKVALTRNRTDAMTRRAKSILDHARLHLGSPYLWGGKTIAGIDCSGLVQVSFASAGVLLPRDADQQANVGKLVATRWFKDALLPGDLLFFVSPHRGNVHHVAIYLGEDEYIQASGKDVHISSLDPRAPNYDAERADSFAWARRVIE